MTRRPLPRARVVAAASLALFLAIFALLAFQLRSGRDPALGAGGAVLADAATPPAKRVLIRKTIVRRVVVHLPAEDADEAPVAVVAETAPAPATAAPAAAAASARAPAPARAPLTTHSS